MTEQHVQQPLQAFILTVGRNFRGLHVVLTVDTALCDATDL
jgi:hypothetical protein